MPGPIVAKGLTAAIHEWEGGRVVKIFDSHIPVEKAEHEFLVTRALHRIGLAVPATFEFLEVNRHPAIVFERITGRSLLRAVQQKPWTLFTAMNQLADIHAALHRTVAPAELPTQRSQILEWISHAEGFTAEQTQSAHQCLRELPQGNVVCHGDFHPENVILSPRGPIVIDWTTGTSGSALSDVARTSILFESAQLPENIPFHIKMLFKMSRKVLHQGYLARYRRITSTAQVEIAAWRPAQIAAKYAWDARGVI